VCVSGGLYMSMTLHLAPTRECSMVCVSNCSSGVISSSAQTWKQVLAQSGLDCLPGHAGHPKLQQSHTLQMSLSVHPRNRPIGIFLGQAAWCWLHRQQHPWSGSQTYGSINTEYVTHWMFPSTELPKCLCVGLVAC